MYSFFLFVVGVVLLLIATDAKNEGGLSPKKQIVLVSFRTTLTILAIMCIIESTSLSL